MTGNNIITNKKNDDDENKFNRRSGLNKRNGILQ